MNLCLRILGVAKSSFYSATGKKGEKENGEDGEDKDCSLTTKYNFLRERLRKVILKHPAYGYRRIQLELSRGKDPIVINHKPLKKLLKLWGLSVLRRIKPKRKSGIEVILDFLGEKVNLIRRLQKEAKALELFFTDYTRLPFQGGKKALWLCPFLESQSKGITGWSVGFGPDSQGAVQAYRQTRDFVKRQKLPVAEGKPKDGWDLMVHQDQGSSFKSYEYVGELIADGVTLSYSRKGRPEDNPEMEAFFGRFKDEWAKVILEAQTEKEVKAIVKKAINYYNKGRIHSNHNCPPWEYLKKLLKRAV